MKTQPLGYLSSTTAALRIMHILFLVVMMLASIPAMGWTVSRTDTANGLCAWNKYVDDCPVPLACQTGVTTSTLQYSPIHFGQVLSSLVQGPPRCLSREFPPIQGRDVITGVPNTAAPYYRNSSVRIEKNGGGVVTMRCTVSNPTYVQLGVCPDSEDQEIAGMPSGIFPEDTMLELLEVQFYNGLLHKWPVNAVYPQRDDFEIELFFRKSEPHGIDPETGRKTYLSQCLQHRGDHGPPDLIMSVAISPSAKQGAVNASVIMRLLDAITYAADDMGRGASVTVELAGGLPLFPFGLDEPSRVRSYIGTMVHPPCFHNIPRIFFSTPIIVPDSVVEALITASSHVANAYDDVTHITQLMTKIYNSVVTQTLPSDQIPPETPEPTPPPAAAIKTVHIAVIILVVINGGLFFYLIILLFARWEWIEVPTALGGLNQEIQFYSPSYEAAEDLAAKGLFVNGVHHTGAHAGSISSESDDEEISGGGSSGIVDSDDVLSGMSGLPSSLA